MKEEAQIFGVISEYVLSILERKINQGEVYLHRDAVSIENSLYQALDITIKENVTDEIFQRFGFEHGEGDRFQKHMLKVATESSSYADLVTSFRKVYGD